MKLTLISVALAAASLMACQPQTSETAPQKSVQPTTEKAPLTLVEGFDSNRFNIYTPVELTADLSGLSNNQKQMIGLLIEASEIMDDLFWQQAFGASKDALLTQIADPALKAFADINYGPWDRLDGDKPFIAGYAEKPLGAAFYPADMTKAEFEQFGADGKDGLYSVVERNDAGELELVSYADKYASELTKAAALLRQAAALADDDEFADYLQLRADAFLSNDYFKSDVAWMAMKNNAIDVVIGPIENYEDQLFGYRTAFEAYVLIKDLAWSERLSKYAAFLPWLQQELPVPAEYKAEKPGSDAELNAYDVVYYAGHSNAGSKTIAINLPNDERVQLAQGSRRLQLKNAMRAKFDQILVPIADQLIVPEQRQHITFNAFFSNTMFHEVAHGLGIKNTLDGTSTVRQALKEHASALEEGKADMLGLYMVRKLYEKGEITEGKLHDYYTTFMAGIFRSVRFGASSAHGVANMLRFNYFAAQDAFSKTEEGLYQVNYDQFELAMDKLSEKILRFQGDGDYAGVADWVAQAGAIGPELAADLDKLAAANIPVDIVFQQGKDSLALN
ncbi:Zn-dependent hydrolase [Neiella marina]|uniref:Zn-dependent hydrolase n=1 Tax=Neiella holothuriorum TaxID=2870530 RepID=A0ABS7EK69_9GAMM|nr:Zn-dependent hydrolase [Neiella holothuriorum]MBW8192263.1 Zn-dependent hydrolase [Neiella holothuriorum]